MLKKAKETKGAKLLISGIHGTGGGGGGVKDTVQDSPGPYDLLPKT